MLRIVFSAGVGLSLSISAIGQTQESAIEPGHRFAQENCARCHAIGPVGDSPLPKAPPFRGLHQRYPVEDLAESLAEGIKTGHPAMPNFELSQDQIDNLIAYLKSLNE